MAFLVDTNVIIDARDGVIPVLTRLLANEASVIVSALSVAELQRGLHQDAPEAALRRARLAKLIEHLTVAPFDRQAAEVYGRIIAAVGWARTRVFDRLIAAHALSMGAVLVTANERDFADVAGLAVENWRR